jgi:hypothetical protein
MRGATGSIVTRALEATLAPSACMMAQSVHVSPKDDGDWRIWPRRPKGSQPRSRRSKRRQLQAGWAAAFETGPPVSDPAHAGSVAGHTDSRPSGPVPFFCGW